MLSIISFIVASLLGIFLLSHYETSKHPGLCSTFSILFLVYSFIGILALIINTPVKYDLQYYDKAKSEYELLNTDTKIQYELAGSFIQDIDRMNNRIEKSKKYHDHIYLSPFFHKEIGELEKINYDTIKAKITF